MFVNLYYFTYIFFLNYKFYLILFIQGIHKHRYELNMRGTVGCYALIDMAANHILLLSTIPLVLLYELYHVLRWTPPPIVRQLKL